MSFFFLLQQSFGQCPTSAPGFVQKPREYGITTRKKVEIIFWRYSRMILTAWKGYVHRYKEVIQMYIWVGNCHFVPNWTNKLFFFFQINHVTRQPRFHSDPP